MADMVKWAIATKATFTALAAKDANTIYFLSDTKELYKGADAYAKGAELYAGEAARPAVGAEGRLYVDTTNGAGYMYVNSVWTLAFHGTGDIAEGSANLATAGAVYSHVAAEIKKVNDSALTAVVYDEDAKTLAVTSAGTTTTKTLKGFATGISYENGKITLTDVEGTEVGNVQIELERFLESAYYDEATASLVFEMKVEGKDEVEKISIPAEDMVQLYEGIDTNTVDVTIEEVTGAANHIKADVKVSAEAGNLISKKDDGLFVAPVDQSSKMDLVTTAVKGNVATYGDNGQVVDSAKSFGGDTFAETPVNTTIPNEASVAAHVASKIQASETTAASTYATKEELKNATDDIAAIKDDYVKVADVVQTVANADATTKVASEAAVVAALTWQVIA